MHMILEKVVLPITRLYWRILKPQTAGAKVVIVFNDSVLLVKNIGSKHWSLPGGGVHNRETAEICAKREVFEELSITLDRLDYILGVYRAGFEGKRDVVTVFVARVSSGVFKRSWEIKDAKWFSVNNLPPETSPATRRRIAEFQEGRKDVEGEW